MSLTAVAYTLRSRRFWIWQIIGITIYAIPVVVRITTGNVLLPILSLLEIPWIGHYVPGNLVEKILVNSFFPGGAGAVAGEIYFSFRKGPPETKLRLYKYRLLGALLWVTVWSFFQLIGYVQNIIGSYGGNLFEYPGVYPLNFLLAILSIFTPTIISYLKSKLVKLYHNLRCKAVKN